MTNKKQVFAKLFGISVSAAMVAFSFSAHAQSNKIRVGLAQTSQPVSVAAYTSVPKELFWQEEGIEAEYVAVAGANGIIGALASGQTDIAIAAPSASITALQKFPTSKIVNYYTTVNGFQSQPAVLKDSKIQSITELAGKTLGVQNLGASQVQVVKALMRMAGGDPNSIKFQPVGDGVEGAYALQQGRVDGLAFYDTLYGQIEAANIPLRLLQQDATSRDKMGFIVGIATTQGYMEKNKDTLVRATRAVAKATAFIKANPEIAVRIHWKHFPATKPTGVSEEEAMRRSVIGLNARMDNVFKVNGLWGYSTEKQIKNYIALLVEGGVVPDTVTKLKFWDPSLIKDINNFDEAAAIAKGRQWKN